MRLDRQRDAASILDALQASEDAIAFCRGMTREDFLADRKTQAAVQHQLLVVGEAVKRISEATRSEWTEVPWRAVAGTRDRLIHGYDSVDLAIVWTMVVRDLPQLIEHLRRIRDAIGPNP